MFTSLLSCTLLIFVILLSAMFISSPLSWKVLPHSITAFCRCSFLSLSSKTLSAHTNAWMRTGLRFQFPVFTLEDLLQCFNMESMKIAKSKGLRLSPCFIAFSTFKFSDWVPSIHTIPCTLLYIHWITLLSFMSIPYSSRAFHRLFFGTDVRNSVLNIADKFLRRAVCVFLSMKNLNL